MIYHNIISVKAKILHSYINSATCCKNEGSARFFRSRPHINVTDWMIGKYYCLEERVSDI